ncbi:demethylepipodophyllotoxin synthase-like [Cornus florida]|uniref:demethylepipodophyllotoxin synthase-like n=1 Tax=Cornus florida TaxID=4283 RepID=UPI0028985748|nr:demethylepipodophyllotoxin synthase-like [Cornus florida]
MESLLPILPTTVMLSIYPLLLVLCIALWMTRFGHKNTASKKTVAPETTGAYPLIGHLHLLGRSQLPHITLGSMADKNGPIFTIKLRVNRALVVSDWEIAKECFTTNDIFFANRPKSLAAELLTYNYAMFGFSPYGHYWRQVRKIVMLELLSNRSLDLLGHIRVLEIRTSLREVYDLCIKKQSASNVVKMEMKQWFADLTLNVMVRLLVGRRYSRDNEEGARVGKAIREFFELLGAFVVSDVFPLLRCLDLGGYEKAMKKIGKEIDDIIEGWLQEHKRKGDSGMLKSDQQDFMDVILSLLDNTEAKELFGFDADTINKATCLGMLTAGTSTTTVTLTWALSLLLNNRHVLRKVQDELYKARSTLSYPYSTTNTLIMVRTNRPRTKNGPSSSSRPRTVEHPLSPNNQDPSYDPDLDLPLRQRRKHDDPPAPLPILEANYLSPAMEELFNTKFRNCEITLVYDALKLMSFDLRINSESFLLPLFKHLCKGWRNPAEV